MLVSPGDDAESIPSQCCAFPYTLDGELYHNFVLSTQPSATTSDVTTATENGSRANNREVRTALVTSRGRGTYTTGTVNSEKRRFPVPLLMT